MVKQQKGRLQLQKKVTREQEERSVENNEDLPMVIGFQGQTETLFRCQIIDTRTTVALQLQSALESMQNSTENQCYLDVYLKAVTEGGRICRFQGLSPV